MTICPKCQYKRTVADTTPDWQCPNCGIAYNKFTATEKISRAEPKASHEKEKVIDPKIETPRQEESWLSILAASLLMFGSALYFYWLLSDFETHGGELRMPSILIGLYKAFGKFGIVGIFALLGFIVGGIAMNKKNEGTTKNMN
jgi:hypothetical protein